MVEPTIVWTDANGDGLPDGGGCHFMGPGFPIVVDVWINSDTFVYDSFQVTVEHEGLRVADVEYTIVGGSAAPIDSTSRPGSLIFSGSGYSLQGLTQIARITYDIVDWCAFVRPIIDAADEYACRLTSSGGAELFFERRSPSCFTVGECFDLAACCLPDGSCFMTWYFCECEAVGGQFLGCNSLCDACPVATRVPMASIPSGALQVFPNPTTSDARIAFRLRNAGDVALSVHDASGRRVRSLVTGRLMQGPHTLTWDGLDAAGHRVTPGTYFLRLTSDSGAEATERVTLVR